MILKAIAINCTLKTAKDESSSTELMIGVIAEGCASLLPRMDVRTLF